MMPIADTLKTLSGKRPVFHSEADFQHAFAWEIQQRLPDASLRLEYPLFGTDDQLRLDVLVNHRAAIVAIELKYKTRALSVRVGEEQFRLRGHSAQDCGRYDFVKDIQRLEQIVLSAENTVGYAIIVTNDSSYWKSPLITQPVDAHFRLHEGRTLRGTLTWGAGAGQGTTRGRERPIQLARRYKLHWEDYSCPCRENYGTFRCLTVSVQR